MNWWNDEKEWEMAKSEMGDVMKRLYPADVVAVKAHPLLDSLPPRPARSPWSRVRARLGTWFFSLAFWVSGDDETEDDE